ncbi:MAG: nicotinate-nucleotide adenylyltransferase [Microcoleaceae cyanobacterium]
MTQIALFGTSADPPTAGHQQILLWLSDHFDRVVVWASDNPFKSNQTDLQHRCAMLQRLVDEIKPSKPNIDAYQHFSNRRTVKTVMSAQQQWPQAQFTLVIGSDLVQQIRGWYQVQNLLKQVKLLVVPRPGYPVDDRDLAALNQLGATVAIASLTGLAVSSTDFREAGDSNALTPSVQAYIDQKHLYEFTSPKNSA